MGFYGNITNTSRTQFQFDKIYPNRVTMDNNAKEDNIYIGRYVLIEYDSSFGRDWADIVYQKSENEFYTTPNFEEETKLNLNLLKNTYIRVRSTLIDIIYYINENAEPIKISELSQEFNSYTENYNIDIETYGPGRGYDSTVWQKTFVNGVEKYVMIAELNTIVPTFDVSADAPTMAPITPHFDSDSTNVYYKLHWQPSWGFRVKEATNLSDETTEWVQNTYDPSTGKINQNTTQVNAEIYYNRSGFSSDEISHSDETDIIKVAPTGVSGNEYNTHKGAGATEVAPDIQELSIILPSIGNSIAEMWDIVYGGKDIYGEGVTKRNRDINWVDATEESSGIRLVTVGEDGYSYNEAQVNTLAGVINSVHDLMGMIIHKDDKADANTADITEWKPDYIYYLSKNNSFYRKVQQYNYTEFIGEITDDMKLYVINDPSGQFIKYSEWNTKIDINLMPNGFKLGTRKEEWVLKELTGFAKNYNTIHGLILRLNEHLDKEETNSLLVQDLLNKFNALTPKAMLGTDELGQLTSVKLIGDKWINVDDWAKKENGNEVNIKHIQKENNEKTEENSEKNLNFGSSFTISEPDISYDAAGHIDSYTIKGTNYTLPTAEALQEIVKDNEAITTLQTSVENNKTNINNLQTSVENNKTSINNLQTSVDSLEETLAGYGDIESSIETINEIKNINYSVDLASNEKIKSISQNAGKVSVKTETITPASIGAEPALTRRPVKQGGGIGQGDNTVYIGWATDESGLKATVDSTDLGKFITSSTGIVEIAKGGTGATNAATARSNLGVTLANLGLTATATELNYMDGVTSNVQTQLQDRYSVSTSRTKNTVLAAPNGSNGGATFRSLVAADLPTIPVAKGGTGATDAATARSNLGITLANLGLTASATELNYMDGVVANVQAQINSCYNNNTIRNANTVLAAPNGSNGTASFRNLTVADLPTISVAKGGTGATNAAAARSNLGITPANIGAQPALGYTPVQQGGGTDQRDNKIYIGWSGNQLLAHVDDTNLGNFVFGNDVSRVNLLYNGASISSGSSIPIGTGAEGYKYLVTTVDSEPCIFHVTGDGGIACTKYVNNNDCFILYGIKINSYSGGNISFGTVRLCQVDNNGVRPMSNTSVVLGPIYGFE